MAIAALVLGILGIILPLVGIPLAIVGLVLGIIARTRAVPAGALPRKGLATAGIVCSALGLVIWPVMAGLTLPAIGLVRDRAREQQSSQNMHQLLDAMISWSAAHDGKGMPPSLEILVQDEHLPASVLSSPGAKDVPMPHYRYVRPVADPDANQIVLVENPACRRHRKILVGFGDGHTRVIAGDGKALWSQAQTLAMSPAASAEGVPPEAWKNADAEAIGGKGRADF